MRALFYSSLALGLVSVTGCPGPASSGADAASGDSATVDVGPRDGGAPDVGATDTGAIDSGRDASAADSGAMDANAGDTGLRDAAAVDAAGSDTGPASFAVAITAPYAYGNCFMGPPDPLTVGWTAHVTGPVGDTITLTQASVHVAVPARSYSEDQVMTVDVRSFAIPAGGVIDQDHRKVSGTPSIPICTFCGDTIESALSVTYASSGGGSVTVNTPLTDTGCVF